jgi:hypothetical protein
VKFPESARRDYPLEFAARYYNGLMADPQGFPEEVVAIRAWLKENQPYLSESFQKVLDAELERNEHSHILYVLIMASFEAGREHERTHPTASVQYEKPPQ